MRSILSSRGFTLLELIIASGIFAMVILVGFAVLSDSATVQSRTDAERLVGQSASFALEAVAREVRLANGYQVIDPTLGSIVQKAPPFTIVGSPDQDQQTRSSVLDLASTDFPNPSLAVTTVKEIRLTQDSTTGHKYIELLTCRDLGCTSIDSRTQLTPPSVEVQNLEFSGLTGSADRKPFVEISMTITTPSGATQTATQTVRTLVTPRNTVGGGV